MGDAPRLFRGWDHCLLRVPARPRAAPPLYAGATAPPGDREACVQVLAEGARRAELRTAVRLASPSLAALIDRAVTGAAGVSAAQLRRAAYALLRYDIRMRTRPTPFGLFAGVAPVRFDDSAKVEWLPSGRTRTYPDMNWLLGVVQQLERDPAVLAGLKVQRHVVIRPYGDRLRLDCPSNIDVAPGGPGRGTVAVRNTAAVDLVLASAAAPVEVADLLAAMRTRFPQAPEAGFLRLIGGLVQNDLLMTSLRPALDGRDPLTHVLAALPPTAPADLTAGLREVDQQRRRFDREGGRDALDALLGAARTVRDRDTPLHVDSRSGVRVRLPYEVRDEVERAVEVLWRMSPHRLGMRPLRPYHEEFLERYGVGRLVPLLQVLDANTGLGAPAGYEWPPSDRPAPPAPVDGNRDRDRLLARLAMTAARTGRREVVLDDDLVARLTPVADERELPTSSELYVVLAAASPEHLDAGDFRLTIAPNPGSHHAGATLGRFLDLLPELAEPVAAAAAGITARVPGAVTATLAYLPRAGRAANIAHSPSFLDRRIAVGLADTGKNEEIRPADLAVGATLDRLFAVHLPTGQEIVPIATTMLSPGAQAPNVARLLFEIGQEGHRLWEPWDWGAISGAPFLPAVRYGRVVLCPATWKLDTLRVLADAEQSTFDTAVAGWREQWDVPRQVMVMSTDQRLVLDLDDPWHRALLREELRKDPDLVAQVPPYADVAGTDGWLRDGAAAYETELVVPLAPRRAEPAPVPTGVKRLIGTPGPERLRGPGTDWLYVRLYGNRADQDEVLRDRLPALLERAATAGADGWFFLRYSDPAPHLRLRLHGDPAVLWSAVLPEVSAELRRWQAAGLAGRTVFDEYDPEWERYGGPAAQSAVEDVFQADSMAAVRLLQLHREGRTGLDVDALAVVSLAGLAHAFGRPVDGSRWVPAGTGADPAAAWLSTTGVSRDLPADFRRRRKWWSALADPVDGWAGLLAQPGGAEVLDALAGRDTAAARYGEVIRGLADAGDLQTPDVRIVGSLMHMTCNRLFGGPSDRERDVLATCRGALLANLDRRRHRP